MRVCETCGEPLGEGVETCLACGASVGESGGTTVRVDGGLSEADARAAGIRPGYSKKFDTPEFQEAMRESNSAITRYTVIGMLAIPAALTLVAMPFVRESWQIMVLSCVVLYIIVIPFAVFQLVKRNTAKTWDGTVVDLVCRTHYRRSDQYYVVCRTKEGKTVKIREFVNAPLYDYLKVGDRVRYHPRLNVPLEKYDKTRDTYLVCPFCTSRQALENDNCDKCGKPLLK